MKLFLMLLACVCAGLLDAQESYTIRMEARVEGLPPEYAAYAEQDITTYIKGDKSKTEVSSMMYTSLVYFRNDSLTMLNDMMGNKMGYTATKSEIMAGEQMEQAPKTDIVYTKEKKMIAGYECTKAIITNVKKKQDTLRVVVWVTDRIKTDQTPRTLQQRRGGVDLGNLKGHPLEMEMKHRQDNQDVTVKMTTLSVDTTALADEEFTPETAGYKLIPFSEWKEKMKNAER